MAAVGGNQTIKAVMEQQLYKNGSQDPITVWQTCHVKCIHGPKAEYARILYSPSKEYDEDWTHKNLLEVVNHSVGNLHMPSCTKHPILDL